MNQYIMLHQEYLKRMQDAQQELEQVRAKIRRYILDLGVRFRNDYVELLGKDGYISTALKPPPKFGIKKPSFDLAIYVTIGSRSFQTQEMLDVKAKIIEDMRNEGWNVSPGCNTLLISEMHLVFHQ